MAKDESSVISSAKAHSRRMEADLQGIVKLLVDIGLADNLSKVRHACYDLDKTIEKWRMYINDIDFQVQELFVKTHSSPGSKDPQS